MSEKMDASRRDAAQFGHDDECCSVGGMADSLGETLNPLTPIQTEALLALDNLSCATQINFGVPGDNNYDTAVRNIELRMESLLESELARLRAENARLREALLWVDAVVHHKTFCPANRGEPCNCGLHQVKAALTEPKPC